MNTEGRKKKYNDPITKILIAVVIALLVGSSAPWWWSDIKKIINPPVAIDPVETTSGRETISDEETISDVDTSETEDSRELEKCDGSWVWDENMQTCIKKVVIPPKTLSVSLNSKINMVAGRMDFYLNEERQPGTNSNGQAMYKANVGAVQVVIPVMKDKVMVGSVYEVIYETKEGYVCSISGLPETTGWLKKMRVDYSIVLETDCNGSEAICQARIIQSGKRVSITTKELTVTIAKNCH